MLIFSQVIVTLCYILFSVCIYIYICVYYYFVYYFSRPILVCLSFGDHFVATIILWWIKIIQQRRSVVKSGGGGGISRTKPSNCYRCYRKIGFAFHFWHKSFLLHVVGLQSCQTTVFSERMWHFRGRGRGMLWPLLHIFRGSGSQPHDLCPWFLLLSITLFCRLRIVLGYFRFRLYTVRCHHRTWSV